MDGGQAKCFVCSSPSVPFAVGLDGLDETTVFDFLCKLFKFPGPRKGKQQLYRAVGNSEFCDSCILLIREAMNATDEINRLQLKVEIIKNQVRKQIIASHKKNSRTVGTQKTATDVVQGLFAQCWSECKVALTPLPGEPVQENRAVVVESKRTESDGEQTAYWSDFHPVDEDAEDVEYKPGDALEVGKQNRRMKTENADQPAKNGSDSEESDETLPFKCYYCPRRFRTRHIRGTHTKLHGDKKPLCCKLCGTGLMTPRLLLQHLTKIHRMPDTSICVSCGLDFKTQKEGEDGDYICNMEGCGQTFLSYNRLRYHHIEKCALRAKVLPEKTKEEHIQSSTIKIEKALPEMKLDLDPTSSDDFPVFIQVEVEADTTKFELIDRREQDPLGSQAVQSDAEPAEGQSTDQNEYPYECMYCPKRFKTVKSRGLHLAAHSTQKPLWCKLCSSGFLTVRLLLNHIVRSHKVCVIPKCALCDKNLEALKDETTGQYKCDMEDCGQEFRHLRELRNHHYAKCADSSKYLDREISARFLCSLCGKSVANSQKTKHIAVCQGPRISEKKIKDQSGDTERPRQRGPQKATHRVKCDACWKTFATQERLASHKLRIHLEDKVPTEYKCDQCDKVVKTKAAMKFHVRNYHEKTFKLFCDQCGKGFQVRSMLQRHMDYVHSEELRFSCEQCGMRFRRPHQLFYHRRTHTGERPYCCHICGRSYNLPTHFKQHMILHKGIKFPCDLCPKSFDSIVYLKYHKKYTHEGKSRKKKAGTGSQTGFLRIRRPRPLMKREREETDEEEEEVDDDQNQEQPTASEMDAIAARSLLDMMREGDEYSDY